MIAAIRRWLGRSSSGAGRGGVEPEAVSHGGTQPAGALPPTIADRPAAVEPGPDASAKREAAVLPFGMPQPPWHFHRSHGADFEVVASRPGAADAAVARPLIYFRDVLPKLDAPMAETVPLPPLALRRGADIVALPGSILVSREFGLLRQSFMRRPKQYHAGLRRTRDDRYVPRRPPASMEGRVLSGAHYYADTDDFTIYGHVLMEVLPKLWALPDAGSNLPVLSGVTLNRTYAKMFAELGVDLDRYQRLDRPTLCETLLIPDVPVARRVHIHPEARLVFDKLKRIGNESTIATPERIYISRSRASGRDLENEPAIEALFEAAGFAIVHPQALSIEDQIRLFANARLIAGTGGSAMHNAVFSRDDVRVLIISSSGWWKKLDMLINDKPGQLGYVFGDPIAQGKAAFTQHARWRVEEDLVRRAIAAHFDLPVPGAAGSA